MDSCSLLEISYQTSSSNWWGNWWSSERLRTFQELTCRTFQRSTPGMVWQAGATSATPLTSSKLKTGWGEGFLPLSGCRALGGFPLHLSFNQTDCSDTWHQGHMNIHVLFLIFYIMILYIWEQTLHMIGSTYTYTLQYIIMFISIYWVKHSSHVIDIDCCALKYFIVMNI